MSLNKSMMSSMLKQYGSTKGKDVYYAMENKGGSETRDKKGSLKISLKHKLRKMFAK